MPVTPECGHRKHKSRIVRRKGEGITAQIEEKKGWRDLIAFARMIVSPCCELVSPAALAVATACSADT